MKLHKEINLCGQFDIAISTEKVDEKVSSVEISLFEKIIDDVEHTCTIEEKGHTKFFLD